MWSGQDTAIETFGKGETHTVRNGKTLDRSPAMGRSASATGQDFNALARSAPPDQLRVVVVASCRGSAPARGY